MFGGIGGAFSLVIGAAGGSFLGKIGLHAFSAGSMAGLSSGGSVDAAWQGALSGGLSSAAGSLTAGLGAGAQIGSGTLLGGIGAEIAGGDFIDGAVQGAITSGLNHAFHEMMKIDLTKNDPDLLENIMCKCLDVFSMKGTDMSFWDVFKKNQFINKGNSKFGGSMSGGGERLERTHSLAGYEYKLQVNDPRQFSSSKISGINIGSAHKIYQGNYYSDNRWGYFMTGYGNTTIGTPYLSITVPAKNSITTLIKH